MYCFYDPDYRALALGKLAVLMEIEFVKEVRVHTDAVTARDACMRIVPLARHLLLSLSLKKGPKRICSSRSPAP